jgi:GxxExxY protein
VKIVENSIHRIHRQLGAALDEDVYRKVLAHELRRNSLRVEQDVFVPVEFEGLTIEEAFRIDTFVEGKILVQIISIPWINERSYEWWEDRLRSGLNLTGAQFAIVANFGTYLGDLMFRIQYSGSEEQGA